MKPWLYPALGALIGAIIGVTVAQFVPYEGWRSAVVGGFAGTGAALGLALRRSRGLG